MQVNTQHTGAALGRRGFLATSVLAGLGTALSGCGGKTDNSGAPERNPTPEPSVKTADEALTRLKAGNARFVAGNANHPDQSNEYRVSLASGQHPFALILSCIDSRVPPEIVFDQGLGDVFVTRTAGHVVDHAVLGSVQYGVGELKVPLVIVLGHEKCGAVKATLEDVEKKSGPHGNDIDALVTAITPAVEDAISAKATDPLDAAVRNNVVSVVARLKKEKVLTEALGAGTLQIVGARYDLDRGAVEFL
jgi:carbonic anhydrase